MGMDICSLDGCVRPREKRTWCATHYSQWRKHGDPTINLRPVILDPRERLRAYSEDDGDCRVWTRTKNNRGYGKMSYKGKLVYVHRAAWELERGPIPDGLHIDHICWNRACVKVSHMRLANNKQNSENVSGSRAGSKAGIRGATWVEQRQKYRATVRHNGVNHVAGFFTDPIEAGKAAEALRRKLFTHL